MLCDVPCGKYSGVDRISNKIFKIAAPVIADLLIYIWNQAITLCTFPNEVKIAKSTPSFKSGEKNFPGNFTSIFIWPTVKKNMDRKDII